MEATFCYMCTFVNSSQASYFNLSLQVGSVVPIPGSSTGNLYVLLHKVYKMNKDHKNKRAQQSVSQNKHQL